MGSAINRIFLRNLQFYPSNLTIYTLIDFSIFYDLSIGYQTDVITNQSLTSTMLRLQKAKSKKMMYFFSDQTLC